MKKFLFVALLVVAASPYNLPAIDKTGIAIGIFSAMGGFGCLVAGKLFEDQAQRHACIAVYPDRYHQQMKITRNAFYFLGTAVTAGSLVQFYRSVR